MELSILNLSLVLLVGWLSGLGVSRLGYPAVLGELLAGIVLGPPILGWLDGGPALAVLAEVGILLMMLYIGMEIDPRGLSRASLGGFLAAVGGFATPFVLCYLLIVWTGGSAVSAVFVGVAAGVTSLATKSRILLDLRLLDTRIAHVMMAGALITDTLSLLIFAAVLGLEETGGFDMAATVIMVMRAMAFFAGATILGLTVFPLLGRLAKGLGRTATFTFILVVGLLFSELAELAGMHGIIGSFLAGLLLRDRVFGRSLSHDLMDLVRHASIGFLAPIFFVTAGFAVSLSVFSTNLGLLVALVALAVSGKILGTMLFYLPTGRGWREGLTLGAGMNDRGAVEIIIAQIGLSAGIITQEIFSILVFMAILTTASVPFLLKAGADWLDRRGELLRLGDDRRGVLILGAGPTARLLGSVLARSQPVRLLDRNADRCALARSEGHETTVGNALDENTLSACGAAEIRHMIALTDNTEVNALAAHLGKTLFLVPEIHVVNIGYQEGHRTLIDHVGASTAFGGAISLSDWDYRIDHGEVDEIEMQAEPGLPADRRLIEERDRGRILPLAIRRGSDYLPFHGGSVLETGDVIVVSRVKAPPPANAVSLSLSQS